MKKILFALLLFLAPAMVRGQIINSSGGSSGPPGTGGFNPNAIYVSPNCQNTPNCFAVNWNTRFDQTCSITNTSTTVTCSDAPFKNADVGKKIAGFNTCNTDGASYSTLIGTSATTIAAVVSSSQITLSLAATGTQATTGCIAYGNPDDAGLASAEALAAVFISCPVMILPAGIGMITSPSFGHTSPPSCTSTGPVQGGTDQPIGYSIQGQGLVSTQVFLTPDFAFGSCVFGHSGHSCFGYIQLNFKNWGLTGGGLGNGSQPATLNIIESQFPGADAGLENFSCYNLFAGDTTGNGTGFLAQHAQMTGVAFDGCEGKAVVASGRIKSQNSTYQDSRNLQFQCLTNCVFSSVNDRFYPGGITNLFAPALDMDGGTGRVVNGQIGSNGVNQQVRGITFDGSSTLYLINTDIGFTTGSTLNSAIFVPSGSIATVSAINSFIGGGSSNGAFAGLGTTLFFDRGNNVLFGPITASPFSVFGSASITGTAQVAGNIALTSGWSTSTVGTVSGASLISQWTVTVAGTPTANPVITVTFPTAFLKAPLCQYQQEGGTFGVITNPAIATTATAATLTFAGTPVAAQTYVMNLSCSNP